MMTSTKCTTASAVTNTSGQLQVPIALAFWDVSLCCVGNSILVIMGVQWTKFIEGTLCAQKAWPYFYDSLAYAIIAQAN